MGTGREGEGGTNQESAIDIRTLPHVQQGSPGGPDGEEPACHAGDPSSIPWLERCPGEGNNYPLQYSCLWTEESAGLQFMRSNTPELLTLLLSLSKRKQH